MGQYDSPYLGMGNNPSNRIDPDGGQDCNCGKGKDNNSFNNWLRDFLGFNPSSKSIQAKQDFFDWWESEDTQNYVKGTKQIVDTMEHVPIFDSYIAGQKKEYGNAGLQLASNLTPFGRLPKLSKLGSKFYKFGGVDAIVHFEKHGKSNSLVI